MKINITETALPGALLIETCSYEDRRGYFKELYHGDDCRRAGLDPAFVGRRVELAQIRTSLELCASERLGHALLVRGEPGIGKTRLTEEATRIASATGFVVRHTLILDFGQGSRQRPVPAMFLQLLGLEPTASLNARTEVVEEARANGIVSPAEEVFLRMALDLTLDATAKGRIHGMSPAERVTGAQDLLADLLERSASRQPVLFVIEDLHWADAPTLGYTAALAQRAAQSGAVVQAPVQRLAARAAG